LFNPAFRGWQNPINGLSTAAAGWRGRTCELLVASGAGERVARCTVVVAVRAGVDGEVLRQRERLAALVARVLRAYTRAHAHLLDK